MSIQQRILSAVVEKKKEDIDEKKEEVDAKREETPLEKDSLLLDEKREDTPLERDSLLLDKKREETPLERDSLLLDEKREETPLEIKSLINGLSTPLPLVPRGSAKVSGFTEGIASQTKGERFTFSISKNLELIDPMITLWSQKGSSLLTRGARSDTFGDERETLVETGPKELNGCFDEDFITKEESGIRIEELLQEKWEGVWKGSWEETVEKGWSEEVEGTEEELTSLQPLSSLASGVSLLSQSEKRDEGDSLLSSVARSESPEVIREEDPNERARRLWLRCEECGSILYRKHVKENYKVCFTCANHLEMNSEERIESLVDANSWKPINEQISPGDPLNFEDEKRYLNRLEESQKRTGLQDAIQTGTAMIEGIPIALGVMDFHFMGGSMGSVVGEKITRLIEYALQEGLFLVLVCASGGARMQEGIYSLMQMAKISGALNIYKSCGNLLYISLLTSPTTGGVTASFAMLGDIIIAEPKAVIGFAGRRVIEQTLQEELPSDFQTAEYLHHHGLVDLIVDRLHLREALSECIRFHQTAPLREGNILSFSHHE